MTCPFHCWLKTLRSHGTTAKIHVQEACQIEIVGEAALWTM
jgi:hypothetical protein